MIKESIQEEDRTSVNMHAPKRGGPQHTRKMLTGIQGGIDSDTIIIGDVSSPMSSTDRSFRQKTETQALNDTLDKTDLIHIYKTFHLKADYTFFSRTHGTFSRIYPMQTLKNLIKLKSYQASSPTTLLWNQPSTIRK